MKVPGAADADLRLHFITAEYLARMRQRARAWSDAFIALQLDHFKRELPDYPELQELLEGELHARQLNKLRRIIRKTGDQELRQMLTTLGDPDQRELVATELEIRGGARRLADGGAPAAAIAR
ncbi:MAG: hypothetical protein K1X75_00745 [Leptospirales bacterium]|nr:hypothetical protein [Leptospirales bacterium]